jgi:large subunit ribosomal protein L13
MARKDDKSERIIIDATDGIMGRIASYAAKQALLGKKVMIVNCSETMISGRKHAVVAVYHAKISRGGTAQKGPYIARTAEGIFKRSIRGMLPWSRTRGREAFKRVMCYSKVPAELASAEKINFKEDFSKPFILMKDLLRLI